MFKLALALLLTQTEIYNEGSLQGRAAKADCVGSGITCSITGGKWELSVSGGSGAVTGIDGGTADDTTLVGNGSAYQSKTLPDCDSIGQALQYDTATNAWGCATSTAVPGWNTALDCDFTAESSKPLDAGDGNYSICGVNFVAFQVASAIAVNNKPAIVNGTGLVMVPQQAPSWSQTTVNAPMFYLPIGNLSASSSIGPFTPLRITFLATSNATTAGDTVQFGIWEASTLWQYMGMFRYHNGSVRYWGTNWFRYSTGGQSSNGYAGLAANAQHATLYWPNGLSGWPDAAADLNDGGSFPTATGGLWPISRPSIVTANHGWTLPSGIPSARIVLITHRDNNAHSGFEVVFKRLKVEYWQ